MIPILGPIPRVNVPLQVCNRGKDSGDIGKNLVLVLAIASLPRRTPFFGRMPRLSDALADAAKRAIECKLVAEQSRGNERRGNRCHRVMVSGSFGERGASYPDYFVPRTCFFPLINKRVYYSVHWSCWATGY